MATTTVRGEIARIFFNGKGAELVETFTVSGKEITKRWTAWFEQPHGLEVGQTVELSGLHGDELNSWAEPNTAIQKYSVKRSLNRAHIITPLTADQDREHPAAEPAANPFDWATVQPPADDPWPATEPEGTPF